MYITPVIRELLKSKVEKTISFHELDFTSRADNVEDKNSSRPSNISLDTVANRCFRTSYSTLRKWLNGSRRKVSVENGMMIRRFLTSAQSFSCYQLPDPISYFYRSMCYLSKGPENVQLSTGTENIPELESLILCPRNNDLYLKLLSSIPSSSRAYIQELGVELFRSNRDKDKESKVESNIKNLFMPPIKVVKETIKLAQMADKRRDTLFMRILYHFTKSLYCQTFEKTREKNITQAIVTTLTSLKQSNRVIIDDSYGEISYYLNVKDPQKRWIKHKHYNILEIKQYIEALPSIEPFEIYVISKSDVASYKIEWYNSDDDQLSCLYKIKIDNEDLFIDDSLKQGLGRFSQRYSLRILKQLAQEVVSNNEKLSKEEMYCYFLPIDDYIQFSDLKASDIKCWKEIWQTAKFRLGWYIFSSRTVVAQIKKGLLTITEENTLKLFEESIKSYRKELLLSTRNKDLASKELLKGFTEKIIEATLKGEKIVLSETELTTLKENISLLLDESFKNGKKL